MKKLLMVFPLVFLLCFNFGCQQKSEKADIEKDFKWCGYSVEDWEVDFKNRVASLKYDSKKRHIAATKKQLNNLVSDEGKTTMEIEKLKEMLLNM